MAGNYRKREGIALEIFAYEEVDIYALCVEALTCLECMEQKAICYNKDFGPQRKKTIIP